MVPSLPQQGPPEQAGRPDPLGSDGARGWRRTATVGGAFLAAVSLAAWTATLALAAGGATPPSWVTALALYGLPVAFLLMAAAIVAGVLERRRH